MSIQHKRSSGKTTTDGPAFLPNRRGTIGETHAQVREAANRISPVGFRTFNGRRIVQKVRR